MENVSAIVTLLNNGEYRVTFKEGNYEVGASYFNTLDAARDHAKRLLRKHKAAVEFEAEVYTLEDI